MSNSDILNLILVSLPYSAQIRDVDMSKEEQVRFTWRGTRFCVWEDLQVESVANGCLAGCDLSIMLRRLLKQAKTLTLI